MSRVKTSIKDFYDTINGFLCRLNNHYLLNDNLDENRIQGNGRIAFNTFKNNLPEPVYSVIFCRNPGHSMRLTKSSFRVAIKISGVRLNRPIAIISECNKNGNRLLGKTTAGVITQTNLITRINLITQTNLITRIDLITRVDLTTQISSKTQIDFEIITMVDQAKRDSKEIITRRVLAACPETDSIITQMVILGRPETITVPMATSQWTYQ